MRRKDSEFPASPAYVLGYNDYLTIARIAMREGTTVQTAIDEADNDCPYIEGSDHYFEYLEGFDDAQRAV